MPRDNSKVSIRSTLLLWLLPLMAAFMLVAWLIHGKLLDRMTQSFVHERLHQEAHFLEKQIRNYYPDVDPAIAASPYFEDVFHHAFAIRTGEKVSASPKKLESLLLPTLQVYETGLFQLTDEDPNGADSDEYIVYRKLLEIDGDKVIVVVAEDLSTLERSQIELHVWTAFVAAGLLLLLICMVLLAVYLAMLPVRQLRRSLQELQSGKRSRLDLKAPREFIPLTHQINALLDQLDQRLKRSRDALANLSHSIKTPIAVVQQVLEDTDRDLDPQYRLKLAGRLFDIDRQLESEMRRSQFAGPQVGRFANPVQQARDMVWMISRLYRHLSFEFHSELSNDFQWPIDEHDLNEIIGNLLDNAGKWARSCVDLVIAHLDDALIITIRDDGNGAPQEELEALGTRGLRLDEQKPGHGLGLAILRDLLTHYDGHVEFNNRLHGGLEAKVTLRLPG